MIHYFRPKKISFLILFKINSEIISAKSIIEILEVILDSRLKLKMHILRIRDKKIKATPKPKSLKNLYAKILNKIFV